MKTLEFIASIINSLAWPVVILIIVILLRKAISSRLSGLTRFKYNNIEMDFSEQIEALDLKIEETEKENDSVVETEEIDKDLEKFKTLAKYSPVAVVLMSWSIVEEEIKSTFQRLSLTPESSLKRNLGVLVANNLIDDSLELGILKLMELRNEVVHNKFEEGINSSISLKYYELAVRTARLLKNIDND